MDYICIGKVVNTHGIKGEIRILSSFDKKEKVFVKGMTLYLGKKRESVVITSYRKHKNFDMVTLEGYDNINDVLRFKGLRAYVTRESLHLGENEYLDQDIIGFHIVSNEKEYGTVREIRSLVKGGRLLEVVHQDKTYFIPYRDEFIETVKLKEREIVVRTIPGLLQ